MDLNTLVYMIDYMLNNPDQQEGGFRIDAEVVAGKVIFHRWFPPIMIGAGHPHRGWVQNYTSRVTKRQSGNGMESVSSWGGGTTQLVRYDLGGMGMLVRYGVQAQTRIQSGTSSTPDSSVGESSSNEVQREHVLCINPNSTDHPTISSVNPLNPYPALGDRVDRDDFIAIKLYTPAHPLEIPELYTRLLLSQTPRDLFVPHEGDLFKLKTLKPEIVEIGDRKLRDRRDEFDNALIKAVELWKRMVLITRLELEGSPEGSPVGGLISFVFTENGHVGVWNSKRDKHRAGLSEVAKIMLGNATRESSLLQSTSVFL